MLNKLPVSNQPFPAPFGGFNILDHMDDIVYFAVLLFLDLTNGMVPL